MNRMAIEESISMLGNAYMQFLLYENKVIKSTGLNTAHNMRDMAKKLSFFLKTHWLRDLTALDLQSFVNSVKIRQGMVVAEFPYDRWGNGSDSFSYMEKGQHALALEDAGIGASSSDDMRLIRTYSNRTGNDFCVQLTPDVLKADALSARAGASDIPTDMSYLKDMYDVAFNHLVSARKVIVPIVAYRKYLSDIKDTTQPLGLKEDYRPNLLDIVYVLKGYNTSSPYDGALKAAWTSLLQAMNMTFVYAKANDLVPSLKNHVWDVEIPESNGSAAFKSIEIYKCLNEMHGYNRTDTARLTSIATSLQTWIESVSRELRGVSGGTDGTA